MPDEPATEPHDEQGPAEQATRTGPPPTRRDAPPSTEARRKGTWFVSPVHLEVVDSTNRYLADLACDGAPEGTCVLADAQSAGRGRLGRQWVDAPGSSVLCSLLFRPATPLERWHLCSVVVMLAARDACAEVAGADLSCKWPNDLVAGHEDPGTAGRKVAGVLAEVVPGPSGEPGGVVVGIGINCNWPVDWPPAGSEEATELRWATSLDRLAGRPVDRDGVAAVLLAGVADRYSALSDGPPAERSLMSEYRRHLATIGRRVRVDLGTESVTGTALDTDDDGRLLVDVGACIRSVAAGDVVHLR